LQRRTVAGDPAPTARRSARGHTSPVVESDLDKRARGQYAAWAHLWWPRARRADLATAGLQCDVLRNLCAVIKDVDA